MNDQLKEKKEKIKGILQTLHDSCTDGEYEYFEPSKEGFSAMAENVQEIVTLLGKTYMYMYMLNIKFKTYTGVETNEWFNCKCTANTRWDIHDS